MLFPDVFVNAYIPSAVLLFPEAFTFNANAPTAVLLFPDAFKYIAYVPNAVFPSPVPNFPLNMAALLFNVSNTMVALFIELVFIFVFTVN